MRAVAQGDGLHFRCRGDFQVQRQAQAFHQPGDVGIPDVAAILAQMRGDAVCAGLFGQERRAQRIGPRCPARIPDRRHMIDIHTQTQHRSLTPLPYAAQPSAGGRRGVAPAGWRLA